MDTNGSFDRLRMNGGMGLLALVAAAVLGVCFGLGLKDGMDAYTAEDEKKTIYTRVADALMERGPLRVVAQESDHWTLVDSTGTPITLVASIRRGDVSWRVGDVIKADRP